MTKKILFITANRVGDAVLSTGVLNHLIQTEPDAAFTIACGPAAADLFRAVPRLEKLIVMQKQKRHGHWRKLWMDCIGTEWDLVVDLRNSLISRLLRRKKLAVRAPHITGQHRVQDNADALSLIPPPAPFLWLDAHANHKADKIMSGTAPFLALAPAANWPAKQWPAFNFAHLAQDLIAPHGPLANAKILIAAAPHERDQIASLVHTLGEDKVVVITDLGLLDVAACLKKARLFIGNDSGLMHIAAAVGTPTLGLFGPSRENVYGPWGQNAKALRGPEDAETIFRRMEYAGASYPNLMTGLSVQTVYTEACAMVQI